jgi:hypothetical protein
MVLRGFFYFLASLVPRRLPQGSHHRPPYCTDAAAPGMVTGLWRGEFPLRRAKGLPGNPLAAPAHTSRMKLLFAALLFLAGGLRYLGSDC